MLTQNNKFDPQLSEDGANLRDNYTARAISEAYADKSDKPATRFPDISYFLKEKLDENLKNYGWQYDGIFKEGRHSMNNWKTTEFGRDSEDIRKDFLLVYSGNEIDDLYAVVKNAETRITLFLGEEDCFSSLNHGTILSEELYCAGWIWRPSKATLP